MSRLKVICDYGKTLDFEVSLYKQGLFRIYQNYYIDSEWLHSQRVDSGDISLTKETAKISIYQGQHDTYYKFGCFFVMNTTQFFLMSNSDLFSNFMSLCRKYKITSHFNHKAVEAMVRSGINKLNETKALRKKGA